MFIKVTIFPLKTKQEPDQQVEEGMVMAVQVLRYALLSKISNGVLEYGPCSSLGI